MARQLCSICSSSLDTLNAINREIQDKKGFIAIGKAHGFSKSTVHRHSQHAFVAEHRAPRFNVYRDRAIGSLGGGLFVLWDPRGRHGVAVGASELRASDLVVEVAFEAPPPPRMAKPESAPPLEIVEEALDCFLSAPPSNGNRP
jgi:hypothetical protein